MIWGEYMKKYIWMNNGVACTKGQISRFEERFGYKLPKEYVDMLLVQNGGVIRYNLYETDKGKKIYIDYILGIDEQENFTNEFQTNIFNIDHNIFDLQRLSVNDFEKLHLLYRCEYEYIVVLDYREYENNREPKVSIGKYVKDEVYEVVPIADSFKKFIDKLDYVYSGFVIGLKSDEDCKEKIIKELNEIFNINLKINKYDVGNKKIELIETKKNILSENENKEVKFTLGKNEYSNNKFKYPECKDYDWYFRCIPQNINDYYIKDYIVRVIRKLKYRTIIINSNLV